MRRVLLTSLSAVVLGACGFEDPTPEDIFLSISGAEGAEVQLVLSTQFAAGVNEVGVTEVSLLRSDTLVRTLPVDTVVSIRIERRFFLEVMPVVDDSVSVRVQVDVDDRDLYDKNGLVVREPPFRYVYLFNQRYTSIVDVVL